MIPEAVDAVVPAAAAAGGTRPQEVHLESWDDDPVEAGRLASIRTSLGYMMTLVPLGPSSSVAVVVPSAIVAAAVAAAADDDEEEGHPVVAVAVVAIGQRAPRVCCDLEEASLGPAVDRHDLYSCIYKWRALHKLPDASHTWIDRRRPVVGRGNGAGTLIWRRYVRCLHVTRLHLDERRLWYNEQSLRLSVVSR